LLYKLDDDLICLVGITRPMNPSAGCDTLFFELLQVCVQKLHRVLPNLPAALSQGLPIAHLGDDLGALILNNVGCLGKVLA
jgi:hypothetical protein